MKNLMELLKNEKCVWVNLKPQERQKFLVFAKANGFKWISGDEISLNDDCWLSIAICNDMTIANIPTMHRVFGNDRNTACKFEFSDILKNKV